MNRRLLNVVTLCIIVLLSACTETDTFGDCKNGDCEPTFCEQNPDDPSCSDDPIVQPDPDPVTYQVTFEVYGGVPMNPQTIEEGDTVIEPSNPVREGYLFQGWYSDQAFRIAYDFSSQVTSDTVLYAKWEQLVSLIAMGLTISNDFDEIMDVDVSGDILAVVGRQGESMAEWDSRLEIHSGDDIVIVDLFGSERDIFTKVTIIQDHIYVFGTTNSTDFSYGDKTTSDYDAMVLQFETDGTFIDYLVLGGSEDNYFAEMVSQNDTIYLTYTKNDDEGYNEAFVFTKLSGLTIQATKELIREVSFLTIFNNQLIYKVDDLYPEYPNMTLGMLDMDLSTAIEVDIDPSNTSSYNGYLLRTMVVENDHVLIYMYRSEGRDYDTRIYRVDTDQSVSEQETYLFDSYIEKVYILDDQRVEWYSTANGHMEVYVVTNQQRILIAAYNGYAPINQLDSNLVFTGQITLDSILDTPAVLSLEIATE
jgi:uncharacterized repeat protein (TIGR02543 family)